jgi:hypothetical protein
LFVISIENSVKYSDSRVVTDHPNQQAIFGTHAAETHIRIIVSEIEANKPFMNYIRVLCLSTPDVYDNQKKHGKAKGTMAHNHH